MAQLTRARLGVETETGCGEGGVGPWKLNNEMSGSEKRTKNRIQSTGKVSLSWTQDGREQGLNGDVMDVSETGMRIRLHDPVPFG